MGTFLLVILIIVLLALVLGGGGYTYRRYYSPSTGNSEEARANTHPTLPRAADIERYQASKAPGLAAA